MKVRAILFCLLLLLPACTNTPAAQTAPTPTPRPVQAALEKPTYIVQKGVVVDELKLSGTVAALKQQELSFTQNGFLKVLYVDRTSVITKGQLLAELDLGELPNQLRQAQVSYEQAKLVLDRSTISREFTIRQAELDLEDAQSKVARLKAPPKAPDVAAARAAVQQAEAARDETERNVSAAKTQAELRLQQASRAVPATQSAYVQALERWNDVKDKPDTWGWKGIQEAYLRADADLRNAEAAVTQAQIEFDTARINEGPALRTAAAKLAEAQSQLDGLLAGPDKADLADAQRAVERANLNLDQARKGGDSEQEKQVATTQLEIERIENQIAAGRLYAPFDGKVSDIGARPGQEVAAYKAVMTVMDDAKKEILMQGVMSQDASKIGIGQQVTITFSRHAGINFNGVITKLPTTATSSAATINPDPAYHVDFDAPDVELEVGDLSQVVITIARKEEAIWLPPQAVRAFEGRRFVVLKEGERQRRQDVRVGIISLERIEILEGLKEGDVIVGQ